MQYKSTRGHETVTPSYALLKGLAEDGGLYVPQEFPRDVLSYDALEGKSYKEIAQLVLTYFFPHIDESQWDDMLNAAYSAENFSVPTMVGTHSLEAEATVLELFHGRTQAFKDMALSIFPYLLTSAKEAQQEEKDILILTATSGDTGKAALAGFADVSGTHIQVFYPTKGVSPIQKEQMIKQEGDNVCVSAIEGNFDDAQQFLKKIFTDTEVRQDIGKKGVQFSSANSINIGRLAPQVVYYVAIYEHLVSSGAIDEGELFDVVVPTGNFGNILAAYYAKLMGIPVGTLICASNRNKVLTDFFETGTYDMNRSFYVTLSPSMDILESSNLERFIYHIFGEDSDQTKEFMAQLRQIGKASISEAQKEAIDSMYKGYFIDDEQTKAIIDDTYNDKGYLVDPHTAVAVGAYRAYKHDYPQEERHTVIVSTAHPYKFPRPIAEALRIYNEGEAPFDTLERLVTLTGIQIPKELSQLQGREPRFTKVIDKSEMKESIYEFIESFTS